MTTKISVELADDLYREVQEFARLHQQPLQEAISNILKEKLIPESVEEESVDWASLDPAVAREMQAYLSLLPTLEEQFKGQYVAIYGGKLVDHDQDFDALFARIDDIYPDEYVWLSKVGDEIMPTFYHRSPRFVQDR